MAPTFRHGKNSRLILSTVDASSAINEMTLTTNVDTAEVTAYLDGDRSYIAGQRTHTISAGGMFDASTWSNDTFAPIRTALGSTSEVIITAIPGGPGGSTVTPGALARMGASRVTSLEVTAPAMNVVATKIAAQVTDRLDFGRTLYGPGAAKTAAFTGTVVDNGSSSTGGGVAHFHITQSSGSVSALVIAVQHSSLSGSGFSDVATSTMSGIGSIGTGAVPAAKRVAVTGNIKRYTRVNVTTFTGGASKSIRLVTAFARRGRTI